MQFFFIFFLLTISSLTAQEQCCHSFFASFIYPNSLVFDVGAHIGKKTVHYRACGARVICIEPQPDCCQELHKKFDSDPYIIIEPCGLASFTGMLSLAICSDATTISTFSDQWQEEGRFFEHGYVWETHIMVPVTTLDILIARYGVPFFCKIDVENFEYEVLKGLTQPIPFISFEFAIETVENAVLCVAYLKNLGYNTFNFAIGEIMAFALETWISADDIIPLIIQLSQEYDWSEEWGLWGDIYARHPS
ncbi:MAG TPA: FkbM family methyltransferase [Candidatus Bathyarchaeia archaeon]|nr:FkbM family methyltransferase [Candidatus Bathyarchaeia archaeon]